MLNIWLSDDIDAISFRKMMFFFLFLVEKEHLPLTKQKENDVITKVVQLDED